MLCKDNIQSVFMADVRICCVYAWVSIETGLFYVGSSVNFKQRCYSHVRSLRSSKHFQLRAHRVMYKFGAANFFPVPLMTVPNVVLRSVERMAIARLQPALNVEHVPKAHCTRILSHSTHRGRRVIRQRVHMDVLRNQPPKQLSVVSMLPGGLIFPDLTSTLQFALANKLKCFDVVVHAGDVAVTHNNHIVGIYGRSSVAWLNTDAEMTPMCLSDVLHEVDTPCLVDRTLRILSLKAVGWRLWATDTLFEVIRAPYTVKSWYKLTQKSFVRLWSVVSTWHCWKQRAALKQLCLKICKSVHHIDLAWVPVLRVPYGLQLTHSICRHFLMLTIHECKWAGKCVQNLWLQNARVVQMQGRSVGDVLGNYRHICKSVTLEDTAAMAQADSSPRTLQIADYNGAACFRGDNSALPTWLFRVTSLHCGYIPAQSLLHSSVMRKLAVQFTDIRKQLKLRTGEQCVWEAWLRSQVIELHPEFPA